jgi:uncharacterized membrane protein YfcA
MVVLIAILTGVVTGVLSGLLGIGGGAILVVSAVFLMGLNQHMAQAAAIVAMIPTALVGVWRHHKNGLIHYPVAAVLALGALAGSVCGAYIANLLPEAILRKVFSIFFVIMSIQLFWSSRKSRQKG